MPFKSVVLPTPFRPITACIFVLGNDPASTWKLRLMPEKPGSSGRSNANL